jgi:hypothetical protein
MRNVFDYTQKTLGAKPGDRVIRSTENNQLFLYRPDDEGDRVIQPVMMQGREAFDPDRLLPSLERFVPNIPSLEIFDVVHTYP